MKGFALGVSILVVCASLASAGEPPNAKTESPKKDVAKSSYKSSPKLSYHSKKAQDETGLENLKPMLNQITGGQSGDAGGAAVPNAGTYHF